MSTNKKILPTYDHLSPSSNQDSVPLHTTPETPRSDRQVQDRLDLYSKGSQEQFFKIQKIKKRFVETTKDQEAKQIQADTHYAQGVRAGLPHARYEIIRSSREQADEKRRSQIIQEAKEEYKSHENLTKWFTKEHGTLEKPSSQKETGSLKKYFPSQPASPEESQQPKGKVQGKDKEMQR